MAYDKNQIFEQAKKLIEKHNLFFIEDIVAFLPCDKTTFYRFFNIGCNEYNELRGLLEVNRTSVKVALRKKWQDSDNATLQMGLMKLVANPEEHKRLSQTYIESENTNKNENFDITKIYDKKAPADLE